MMRPHITVAALITLAVAGLTLTGCRQALRAAARAGSGSSSSSASSGPSRDWDRNDKELNDAVQRARLNMDSFIDRLASPKDGDEAFAVCVEIKEGARSEHFWLEQVEFNGNDFFGIVSDWGGIVRVRPGERIRKPRTDICDWLYVNKGRVYGAETIRVMRDRMSQTERAEFDRETGLKF